MELPPFVIMRWASDARVDVPAVAGVEKVYKGPMSHPLASRTCLSEETDVADGERYDRVHQRRADLIPYSIQVHVLLMTSFGRGQDQTPRPWARDRSLCL